MADPTKSLKRATGRNEREKRIRSRLNDRDCCFPSEDVNSPLPAFVRKTVASRNAGADKERAPWDSAFRRCPNLSIGGLRPPPGAGTIALCNLRPPQLLKGSHGLAGGRRHESSSSCPFRRSFFLPSLNFSSLVLASWGTTLGRPSRTVHAMLCTLTKSPPPRGVLTAHTVGR